MLFSNKCHFWPFKNGRYKENRLFISISQFNTIAMEEHFWYIVEKKFYSIPNFIKNAFE